jgi:hypothetical protein
MTDLAKGTEETNAFKIIYNSDLIIRDYAQATTLCVFYDQVLLPYTTKATRARLTGTNGLQRVDTADYRDDIDKWELEYGTLFDEGVLARLPPYGSYTTEETALVFALGEAIGPPLAKFVLHGTGNQPQVVNDRDSCTEGELPIIPWYTFPKCDHLLRHEEIQLPLNLQSPGWPKVCTVECWTVRRSILHTRTENVEVTIDPDGLSSVLAMPVQKVFVSDNCKFIRTDLIKHLLRSDIDKPQIFTTLAGRPIRDVLVALEAEETFRYLLPKIRAYHATQILELRERVADTREGFTMHLWKLSKGLEEHARENTPVKEIAQFAKNLVETELLPDYKEFQRQLKAIDARSWNKILDVAGKVVEIDAAPWTPKFWGLLLKALGMTVITAASERAETLSNKYQAFQFMGELEAAASRFVAS